MEKLCSLLMLLVIVGCSKTVDKEIIDIAIEVCGPNGGLDRIESSSVGERIYCNNGMGIYQSELWLKREGH